MTGEQIAYSFAVIAVVSFCTILLRAFPFLIFGGKREVPSLVKYLGDVLPASIMAVLVVYCFKSINLQATANWLPAILAGILVAVLHLWRKNILLSIGAGTVCYMILIQMVF